MVHPLKRPTKCKTVRDNGNCLFRALSHAITGSDKENSRLRSQIVENIRSLRRDGLSESLETTLIGYSVEDHFRQHRIDQDGSWGTDVEVAALSHLLGTNIALYDIPTGQYVTHGWTISSRPFSTGR